MDNTTTFPLNEKSPTEIAEARRVVDPLPVLGANSLASILSRTGPLPHEAVFLGLAEDGLPVLLNLYDPIPGPILIASDPGGGKTNLLRMIAFGTSLTHSPADLQFDVITSTPGQWSRLLSCKTNAGIHSVDDEAAAGVLQFLVAWAHANRGAQQSMLLLIDGLDRLINSEGEASQNFRWLLLRGPSHRVWPIVTLDAQHAKGLEGWMAFFHTRLFGFISDPEQARQITGKTDAALDRLSRGSEFLLHEGDGWLKFHSIPV